MVAVLYKKSEVVSMQYVAGCVTPVVHRGHCLHPSRFLQPHLPPHVNKIKPLFSILPLTFAPPKQLVI